MWSSTTAVSELYHLRTEGERRARVKGDIHRRSGRTRLTHIWYSQPSPKALASRKHGTLRHDGGAPSSSSSHILRRVFVS